MARDNKVRMPSSGAGITQYWDNVKTSIDLKPSHIVALCIIVIIVMIILNVYGVQMFGLK